MVGISDKTILHIAEALGDNDKLMTLGLELGFKTPRIKLFLKTNRMDGEVSSRGTHNMLIAWREGVRQEEQRKQLKDALMAAQLVEIAEKFPEDDCSSKGPGIKPSTNTASAMENTDRTGEMVTEAQLIKLSGKVPNGNYTAFCNNLGVGYTPATNILIKHGNDYEKSILDVLMEWKTRTGGYRADLDKALRDAKIGGLCAQF